MNACARQPAPLGRRGLQAVTTTNSTAPANASAENTGLVPPAATLVVLRPVEVRQEEGARDRRRRAKR